MAALKHKVEMLTCSGHQRLTARAAPLRRQEHAAFCGALALDPIVLPCESCDPYWRFSLSLSCLLLCLLPALFGNCLVSIYSPLRSLSNFHRECLFVELSVLIHIIVRFLQGTWIAEVRVQGGVGGGNGFIATTMPAQGTLVGRYYENVTDSSDVKSQFIFQVKFNSEGSKC